jgi:hypothetical protein
MTQINEIQARRWLELTLAGNRDAGRVKVMLHLAEMFGKEGAELPTKASLELANFIRIHLEQTQASMLALLREINVIVAWKEQIPPPSQQQNLLTEESLILMTDLDDILDTARKFGPLWDRVNGWIDRALAARVNALTT